MVTDKILNKFFEEHILPEVIISDYDRLIQERRDMFSKLLLDRLVC